MRLDSRFACVPILAVLALLIGCAAGPGGRTILDTRDLVVDAEIPATGFWYVAEATAADAVDDVELSIAPLFEGDSAPSAQSGLAPLLVSYGVSMERESIEVDFEVTSFDTAENAEVRCSVYLDGALLVEDIATGASPVASCQGEFRLEELR